MIRPLAALAVLSCLVSAQTVYVDDSATGAADGSSWTDAFPDLQAALSAATPGSQVWVAEGVYTPAPPGGARTATFTLGAGVQVLGGFDGTETTLDERQGLYATTVLSGDLDGDDQPGFVNTDDNVYHVLTVAAGTTGALLDGFTVTGGNAEGPGPSDRSGGGLFSSGGVTARNVTFTANQAQRWGGAVHVEGTGATSLEDCELVDNHANNDGGAVHQSAGALNLVRSTIAGNTSGSNGGGL